jgi:hypothetical protein
MFKRLLIVSLLVTMLSVAASAKADDVNLRIGQTKVAAGGKLSIKFIGVMEDSRCPMNARCVWAGNAKIKISVAVGRRAPQIFELNSNTPPQNVTVAGYRISLQDLNPQKGQPADWPKGPVRATISVEKVK